MRLVLGLAAPAARGLNAPRDATEKVGAIKDRLKAKTSASAPALPPPRRLRLP